MNFDIRSTRFFMPNPFGPNTAEHGKQYLPRTSFLKLVHMQLAVDRGMDVDCCLLNLHSARRALLKVRSSSHGYVFVARGVKACHLWYLRHEAPNFQRLRPVQGVHVPVCYGIFGLRVPYLYDNAELIHVVFMSWAGRSVPGPRHGKDGPHLEDSSELLLVRKKRRS